MFPISLSFICGVFKVATPAREQQIPAKYGRDSDHSDQQRSKQDYQTDSLTLEHGFPMSPPPNGKRYRRGGLARLLDIMARNLAKRLGLRRQ
jgi:hypothetical protein